MFYSSSGGSGGGSDPLSMSKSDILRGIITEKLSTAAREILAVVERTVADYEQEAAGYRRQLELLQPRVALRRRDVEGAETHRETGELAKDEEEEEEPEAASKRIQEDLKDPDYETLPKPRFSRAQTAKRRKRSGRTRTGASQNRLSLRVWFLEDPNAEVLPETACQGSPASVLECPRGLSEASFLNLLRSSLAPLAAGGPFDLLTSDPSRKLRPLVATTPEEIWRAGNPPLYVRLKKDEVLTGAGPPPPLLSKATSTEPLVLKSDESGFCISSDGSSGQASPHPEAEPSGADAPVLWNDVMRVVVKEEDASGPDLTSVPPDPEEPDDPGSGLHVSSSEAASGSEGDSLSGSSSSDLDSDDDSSDSSSDTDQPTAQLATGRRRQTVGAEPQRHPGSGMLACKVCGTWYRQLGSLISHTWNHVNEPHGVCGVCGESSGSVAALKQHLTGHKKGYSCWLCGKYLLSSVTLNRHIAKHVAGSHFSCSVCGKTFGTASALNGHSRVHARDLGALGAPKPQGDSLPPALAAPDWPSACSLCGLSFASEEEQKAHAAVHPDQAPCRCSECGRGFKRRSYLANHMRTHGGVRLRLCSVCGQVFNGERALGAHMRTHGGEPL